MHRSLISIRNQLVVLINTLTSTLSDDPFSNSGQWNSPGLDKLDLIIKTQDLINLIDEKGKKEIGDEEIRLDAYLKRLVHLQNTVIPHIPQTYGQASLIYLATLDGLRQALNNSLYQDESEDISKRLRTLNGKLRGMEATLNGIPSRMENLDQMLEHIQNVHNAADRFPADLESLEDAKKSINRISREAQKDSFVLTQVRNDAESLSSDLEEIRKEASLVLTQSKSAFSAATSVGLAAAFTERSIALTKSIWFWIAGLVVALSAGSYFGSQRLQALSEMLKYANSSNTVIFINLVLSLLSVAAPIWFAWLATKQIGHRFKLSEDYAFKASVSRAYEGYRSEAARIDKNLEARLLASALDRLDELPLRFVDNETHGSPWHEIASSAVVKDAINSIPGFAKQVKDIAENALGRSSPKSLRSETAEGSASAKSVD